MNQFSLLITCEHAGNQVPDEFSHVFTDASEILNSHRGWDPGALQLAMSLGEFCNIEPILYFPTRLLIEPNRSLTHPELLSEYSKLLQVDQQHTLIKDYYLPYRNRVETIIQQLHAPVLHLSIHTFTPVFKAEERKVDVGLLFDPERASEEVFCQKWKIELERVFPDWKIEFNEPYKGIDDGFTTYLRNQFPNEQYLGIELEWNQKWAASPEAASHYAGIKESLAFVTRLHR